MESDSRKDPPVAKKPRIEEPSKDTDNNNGIPTFPLSSLDQLSSKDFMEAFQLFQAVHFKASEDPQKDNASELSWKDIGSIYQELEKEDQASWCVENGGINKEHELGSKSFLAPKITDERAYCSFLIQKDKDAYNQLLARLPLARLSFDQNWSYEPCLWIFYGRNPTGAAPEPLEGRGLHTDSVSHDGTWHYQLSGTKLWFLSPSCDLLNLWKQQTTPHHKCSDWDESTCWKISCRQGDVLVVNTRLWFHRTVIPSQESPSVSYARDFRLATAVEHEQNGMTNLDGLYARDEIEPGTIIFKETDMPDCEIHRSKDNPNCEVVELEDGTCAVVSKRTIACGEFFCVPESSDEEEEEGEFVEEEEEASDGE